MALEAAVAAPTSSGGGGPRDDDELAEAAAVPAAAGGGSDDDQDNFASSDEDEAAAVESPVNSSPYGKTRAERVSRLTEAEWAAEGAKQSGLQEEFSSVDLVDNDLQQRVLGDMAQLARVADNLTAADQVGGAPAAQSTAAAGTDTAAAGRLARHSPDTAAENR